MRRLRDERVISERRKISSKAFGICFIGLWCILMYRQFILKQSSKEYMDIYFLVVGVSLYVLINSIKAGVYLSENKKKRNIKLFVISGAIATIVFTVVFSRYIKPSIPNDIPGIIIGAGAFFATWIVLQIIAIKLSQKQANKDIE